MNNQAKIAAGCCTTPAAMRYWTIIFIAALLPLILAAIYWQPLSGAAVPFAAGIACGENWRRNRTYHCRISGPILFVTGAVLLVADMRLIPVRPGIVWIFAGVGIIASFFLEWRYARRSSHFSK